MLWSQFSAIFANFGVKIAIFGKKNSKVILLVPGQINENLCRLDYIPNEAYKKCTITLAPHHNIGPGSHLGIICCWRW
jgi:hypothetical protein